jgi:glycosyltransferase involved in cell wall biosynthesis
VIRNATHRVVNSQFSHQEAIEGAGADPSRISLIYHGVRTPEPGDLPALEGREPLVLTVGAVLEENLLRKGLLPFVQSAAYLPDTRFVLVGQWHDSSAEHLNALATPNVELAGFLPDDELWALYSRASVYVQASLHESFGLSLAEACAAGCAPVLTRVGAMPEVVGEEGVYSPSNQPEALAAAIRQALEAPVELRERAQRRVLSHFPMQRRKQSLEQLLRKVASGTTSLSPRTTQVAGN